MTVEPEASGNNPENNKKRKIPIPVLILLVVLVLASAVYLGLQLQHQKELNSVLFYEGVMNEDELSSLDQYPNLKTVDLTGSTCYSAIESYVASHSGVQVNYTVDIDGVAIENTQTVLDWAGHDFSELVATAPHLQQLTEIDLGTTTATMDEIQSLQTAFPQALIRYDVAFNGKTYPCDTTEINFSMLTSAKVADAVALLKMLPDLKNVNLNKADNTSSVAQADYITLYNTRPDIHYNYTFELFGQTFSTDITEMKFKKVEIGNDGAEEIRAIMAALPNLTYLSIDRCDVDDETMEQIREDFPTVKVAWRVTMWQYSCMTDTEKFWAQGGLTDETATALKYCIYVRYLDLGHNNISDISFIANMPDLEVLILAITKVTDVSVLADCSKLEYLELTLTDISDISPLENCTNLRHLELSQMVNVTDITPIMHLDLERFHMMYNHNHVPDEQFEEFKELHPDCDTDFSNGWEEDPFHMSDWRISYQGGYAPRYAKLREQIGYDDIYGQSKLYWFEDYPIDGSGES